MTSCSHKKSLFKRPVRDVNRYRNDTVQEWLKHFSAKEEESKRRREREGASDPAAFVASPRAKARSRLVLSWYQAGAVPWEEVSWTDYMPGVPKGPAPNYKLGPLEKKQMYLSLVHTNKYEELEALLQHLNERPSSDLVDAAFYHTYPPIFLLCLKHGGDPNRRLKGGMTYLHIAAHKGDTSLVQVLIRHVHDVNIKNNRGLTPLHLACQPFIPCFDKRDIIDALLQSGADVNAQDNAGKTPLHHAIRTGGSSAVALLLRAGADVCLDDAMRRLPIDRALDDPFRNKAMKLFSSCLSNEELRRMQARRLSRQVWAAILNSFKGRCIWCRRYNDRCRALKRTQLVWWLWSHDKIPH